MENEHFSKLCVALKHIVEDVVKQQIQALAEEQQAVRQELLGELQFISEMVKLGPGRSTEPKGSWPRRLPKGQSKESGANVSNELMESSSEVASAVRTPVIPKEDLEKAILRPTRKTNAGECLKCKAGKKHSKKLHISRCEC
eukprot:g8641.t1